MQAGDRRQDSNNEEGVVEKVRVALQNLEHDEERLINLKGDLARAIDFPHRVSLHSTDLEKTLALKTDAKFLTHKPIYSSPRDLAHILHVDATRHTVMKLFENQYKIKWQTKTGDPDKFSFYGFCKDVEDTGDTFLTYNIRRAHVIANLCREKEKLHKSSLLNFKQLCPPIYARKQNGTWVKWTWNDIEDNFKWTDQGHQINWISNASIKEYIEVHSKSKNPNHGFPTANNQIYWAVFEEDDLVVNDFEPGDLTAPFKTQVYVGKAANGIKQRWLGPQGKSHCKLMKKVQDIFCQMSSNDYVQEPDSFLLVQLRLLLHKALHRNGENSGLFIMGEYADASQLETAETKNINGQDLQGHSIITPDWKPSNMKFGLNYDNQP